MSNNSRRSQFNASATGHRHSDASSCEELGSHVWSILWREAVAERLVAVKGLWCRARRRRGTLPGNSRKGSTTLISLRQDEMICARGDTRISTLPDRHSLVIHSFPRNGRISFTIRDIKGSTAIPTTANWLLIDTAITRLFFFQK